MFRDNDRYLHLRKHVGKIELYAEILVYRKKLRLIKLYSKKIRFAPVTLIIIRVTEITLYFGETFEIYARLDNLIKTSTGKHVYLSCFVRL